MENNACFHMIAVKMVVAVVSVVFIVNVSCVGVADVIELMCD